jgi:hypothetical protein
MSYIRLTKCNDTNYRDHIHYNAPHYTTLYFTTLHCDSLHYTNTNTHLSEVFVHVPMYTRVRQQIHAYEASNHKIENFCFFGIAEKE